MAPQSGVFRVKSVPSPDDEDGGARGMSRRANERRRSQRQRRRLDVRFWNDELEGRGFTTNVSNKGLLVETNKTLRIGQRFHLEIILPETSFYAEAVVVRRKVYPPQARSMFKPTVGLRFVGMRELVKSISSIVAAATDGGLRVDLSDPARLAEVYERDIRHGGLLVSTSEEPEVDSEVTFPLILPPPHGQIECRGTVVKLSQDPPAIALRLAEVDQVRRRLIEIIRGT